MKNEKCEKLIGEYLALDKNELVPLPIALHLMACKKCRTQIKMLSAAEKAAAKPVKLQAPLSDKSIEAVMLQTAPEAYRRLTRKPISMTNWIVSGLVMILALLAPVLFAAAPYSGAVMIPYALLFAGCVTVYCSIFVVCNLDFFVKRISVARQYTQLRNAV